MSELRAGGPGLARREWLLLTGVLLAAVVAWLAFAVVPERLADLVAADPPGTGVVVTGAVAGGAAAGCVSGLVRGRARTVRRLAVAAVLAGGLGAAAVTLLWGSGAPGGIAAAVVVVASTAGGLALGLLATHGPGWLRACALAVPITFGQDALAPVVPRISALGLDTHWLVAVLIGLVLGISIARGRRWTWLMWIPALVLVWFAQSAVLAVDAMLQQLYMGGYLREYPLEPLLTLGEHLSQTLVTPGDHGVVAMWAIALQVGLAIAAWRLRGPR
ncbi:hypothetical protein GCM10027059_45430 [Myceligenerans halotolerans]